MKRYHNRPVTEAVALEALELDAADAADYARYGTAEDRADAATAADTLERARCGDWDAPAVARVVDVPTAAPRHRCTVRPVDSYSLAVDPFRAPRHLNYSATPVALAPARVCFAPHCDATISAHMPFCAPHMVDSSAVLAVAL